MAKHVAAIDVGSNAVRMGIARLDGRSGLEYLQVHREPLRLGQDSFTQGRISTAHRRSLVETFQRFKELFDQNAVVAYRAVATSALRDAANAQSVIDEIRKRTRIQLEVIDGLEEARLIHTAVVRSRCVSTAQFMLVDIGGGSVEIVVSKNSQIQFIQSLPAGTVRLLGRSDSSRDAKAALRQQIEKHLAKIDSPLRTLLQPGACEMVATGGNPRTLGRLRADVFNKTNRAKIKRTELEFLVDNLFGCSDKERMQRYQLGANRVDVILPASMILLRLMEMFEFTKIKLPPEGLKEGLIYGLFDSI
jgi:exopolyphosphatase/guanosine-5'-triphosphate,3'-diphosphate pyrophosphatase